MPRRVALKPITPLLTNKPAQSSQVKKDFVFAVNQNPLQTSNTVQPVVSRNNVYGAAQANQSHVQGQGTTQAQVIIKTQQDDTRAASRLNINPRTDRKWTLVRWTEEGADRSGAFIFIGTRQEAEKRQKQGNIPLIGEFILYNPAGVAQSVLGSVPPCGDACPLKGGEYCIENGGLTVCYPTLTSG